MTAVMANLSVKQDRRPLLQNLSACDCSPHHILYSTAVVKQWLGIPVCRDGVGPGGGHGYLLRPHGLIPYLVDPLL